MSIIGESDQRIVGAYLNGEGAGGWMVGHNGVTSITAFDDNGVGGLMPWLSINNGADVICRIPAWQVSIHYETPNTDMEDG